MIYTDMEDLVAYPIFCKLLLRKDSGSLEAVYSFTGKRPLSLPSASSLSLALTSIPSASAAELLEKVQRLERGNGTLKAKYRCDISFVGNLYNEEKNRLRQVFGRKGKRKLSDYTSGYVEGLISSQLQVYGYNLLSKTKNIITFIGNCFGL